MLNVNTVKCNVKTNTAATQSRCEIQEQASNTDEQTFLVILVILQDNYHNINKLRDQITIIMPESLNAKQYKITNSVVQNIYLN